MIGTKMKHKNYKGGNEKKDNVFCTPKNKDYSSTILLEDQFLYGIKYIYGDSIYFCNSLYTYHQYYYKLIQHPT